VTKTGYYPGGQTRATTNALGATHGVHARRNDRVTGTMTTLGSETLTTAATYDPKVTSSLKTDSRGHHQTHTYDALNRLTETSISGRARAPAGRSRAILRPSPGNKETETDINGFCTTFEYDGL